MTKPTHQPYHSAAEEKAVPFPTETQFPLHVLPKPKVTGQTLKRYLRFAPLMLASLIILALLGGLTYIRADHLAKSQELSHLEAEVSQLKTDRSNKEQEVNELSQYERINAIAKEKGLKLDEDNLRNVES